MKIGVVVFPGANCDRDALRAASSLSGAPALPLWHESSDLAGVDAVILPGGFSYGDYLRAGAIARFSPILDAVRFFAAAGGPVLGVCNGFQILCEAGLLPGALVRNAGLRFVCRPAHVRVEATDTPFTGDARRGQILRLPVAHGEGNYLADPDTLARLRRERRVVFRYCQADGAVGGNPNGSLDDIAGVCNEGRNVVGLMPHPERACDSSLGSDDGRVLFRSLLALADRGA